MVVQTKIITPSLLFAPITSQQHITRAIPFTICHRRHLHQTPRCQRQSRTSPNWARRDDKLTYRIRKQETRAPVRAIPSYRTDDGSTVPGGVPQQKNLSPAAQQKTAIEEIGNNLDEQRQDMGLAPTTWISTTGANRQELWSTLFSLRGRDALKYWFYQAYANTSNWILLLWHRQKMFGWQTPYFRTENRRKADKATRYKSQELVKLAMNMHEDIYKAYADARITDVEAMCLEGLAESMRQRMSRRSRYDVLSWSRDSGATGKLVSFKQVPHQMMHKGKQIYVQQATVRITGAQRLRKGLRLKGKSTSEQQEDSGENIEWEKEEMSKPMMEYLVLQRRLLNFEPTEWLVWGFTDETTLNNYKTTALKAQDLESKMKRMLSDSSSGPVGGSTFGDAVA